MTAIDWRIAGVTVRVVEPEIVPDVAMIIEVPTVEAVASPLALMVATAVVRRPRSPGSVRSYVELSERCPWP